MASLIPINSCESVGSRWDFKLLYDFYPVPGSFCYGSCIMLVCSYLGLVSISVLVCLYLSFLNEKGMAFVATSVSKHC